MSGGDTHPDASWGRSARPAKARPNQPPIRSGVQQSRFTPPLALMRPSQAVWRAFGDAGFRFGKKVQPGCRAAALSGIQSDRFREPSGPSCEKTSPEAHFPGPPVSPGGEAKISETGWLWPLKRPGPMFPGASTVRRLDRSASNAFAYLGVVLSNSLAAAIKNIAP